MLEPTICATLRCGAPRPRHGDRKALAHELHGEVTALHAASAREFGVRDAAIKRALRGFKPLPHRLEKVGTFGRGTPWIGFPTTGMRA